MRGPGRTTLEMWMPPTADLMLGASRTVINGVVRESEQLRLRAAGDTLVYTALPSGQQETDFRSTRVGADTIVFENPAHDFPQRIIYRRSGSDSLIARVEGPGPNNTTRGFSVPMRRVDCTQPIAAPIAPPPDTVVIDAEYSRDGRELLVVRGVGQNWDVYRQSPDGYVRLTDHAAVDYQPAWSPDGRSVAFTSVRDGHQEIYLMRPDGSGIVQLTRGSAHNSEPSWSPDGRRILFRSERDSAPQLYVMNADGSDQRPLTRGAGRYTGGTWSPDRRRIAYSSMSDGHLDIHVMSADGTGSTQLTTTTTGHTGMPHWSPDGRRIAFWTTRDGNDEVYLMEVDGSNPRNVTNHPARDVLAGWTPDGQWLLFRSNRDRAQNELYRMKPDGSNITRLTHTTSSSR
jgi:Tol biopolymer transport system component